MTKKVHAEQELFTIRDLCDRTGKCYRTIHRKIGEGRIKTVRLGASIAIPKAEVERILAKGF